MALPIPEDGTDWVRCIPFHLLKHSEYAAQGFCVQQQRQRGGCCVSCVAGRPKKRDINTAYYGIGSAFWTLSIVSRPPDLGLHSQSHQHDPCYPGSAKARFARVSLWVGLRSV